MKEKPGPVEKAGRVGDAFKAILGLGSMMADLDPTGSAKIVMLACTKAWEHLEQQEQEDVDMTELVQRISRMVPSAESVQDLADESLKETVMDMLNLAEDLSLFVLNSRPRSSYERLRRVAISSDRGERTGAYISRFKDLRREFDTRVGVQGLRGSAADRQAAETDRINAKLRELKPVNLAGYDPARQCIPGTRLELTDELAAWARASNGGPRLAWVKGPAGFGKSSIATSLCVRLSEHKALASSFFCKRDAADLRDPRRVLTTVVYGMASRWEAYREAVARAIGEDLELHSKHVQPLYESL
ncbi:WD repeat-containing protein 38, partial [Ceratobasidium sp. 392]